MGYAVVGGISFNKSADMSQFLGDNDVGFRQWRLCSNRDVDIESYSCLVARSFFSLSCRARSLAKPVLLMHIRWAPYNFPCHSHLKQPAS